MEFKKIQLNGFKSFAEKTNFLIEKGLTGIVGPNGCGKSNIVESLRWCMGETSAKSMRGSGMEDVIFSGTSNKPSKNIAEVVLSLNNENKDASLFSLFKLKTTSAIFFDGLFDVPENITSSIPEPLILLAEVSPIHHLRDSTMFDLPQPFGPTIPVSPFSIKKFVFSANDLKPFN